MKLLITGANGFIGRHVVELLLRSGHQVHAVCGHNRVEGAIVHQVDLLKSGAAAALMQDVRPERLLHLAWCAKPGVYWHSAENLNWVRASLELLESFQAYGGEHAVLVGSCAEYDWSGDSKCLEEQTPLSPSTLYGRCKNLTQELARLYACTYSMPLAWARVFNAFGPYEASGRLVPSVLQALLKGEPARCSHGEQLRDFLHVSDVAAALVHLLTIKADGVFNIGSGQAASIRFVVEYLAQQLDARALVKLGAVSVSASEPAYLVADNQRLLATGWQPRLSLTDGLDDALAWWRKTI